MMDATQDDCKEESDKRGNPNKGSEFIMDDNMLFTLLLANLLNYLEVVIEVLSH